MILPFERHAGTLLTVVLTACTLLLVPNAAMSQTERLTPRSTCQAVAHNQSGSIRQASSTIDLTVQSKLGIGEVSINYVAHSTLELKMRRASPLRRTILVMLAAMSFQMS